MKAWKKGDFDEGKIGFFFQAGSFFHKKKGAEGDKWGR